MLVISSSATVFEGQRTPKFSDPDWPNKQGKGPFKPACVKVRFADEADIDLSVVDVRFSADLDLIDRIPTVDDH